MHSDFISLVLIVCTAFLVPMLVSRIRKVRIPTIVAEIFFGIILGKSGLDLIVQGQPVDFLASFGFIFLMFLSGFDIDFSILASGRGRIRNIVLPFFVFFATLLLSFVTSTYLMRAGFIRDNYLFALILSTTSVGIVMPIIKESMETQTRYGQVIIITSLLADILTVSLLTIYVVHYTKGIAMEFFLIAGIILAFLIIYSVGRLLTKLQAFMKALDDLAHASTQIKVRGGLALVIVFVALSEFIGVEAIFGAFLAGLFLSIFSTSGKEVLSMKLDAIGYGFFIPIFFIMVGARLDLPALFSSPRSLVLVPIIVGLAYLVKILPALLLSFQFRFRESLAGGILISSRLSLIIAASEIALSLGIISANLNTAIVIVAIITSLFSPIAYHRIRGEKKKGKPKVVIAGMGRVGRDLYERIRIHTSEVLVIEDDVSQLRKISVPPQNVIVGHCKDLETQKEAKLNPTDVYIAVTGSDEDNLQSCLLAKQHFGVNRVIARDNNPENTERFRKEGIIPLNQTASIALAAENLILRPSLAQLLVAEEEGLSAFEVMIRNPQYFDIHIKDFRLIKNALILLIKREEETLVPHGDTLLEKEDRIVVFGSSDDEYRLRSELEAEP